MSHKNLSKSSETKTIELNGYIQSLVASAVELQEEADKHPVSSDQWQELAKSLHDIQREIGACTVFMTLQ